MHRTACILFLCTLLGAAPPSKSPSPEQVVARQIEAYNAHDVEAFAATYGDDVELSELPSVRPAAKGKANLKADYVRIFKENPDLHASAKDQIVSGGWVIHREKVTGLADRKEPVEVVVIYQVKEGLIRKVWFLAGE